MNHSIIKYDPKKYNFIQQLEGLFEYIELENIECNKQIASPVGKDSDTELHTIFYDKYRSGWPEFENLYFQFITEVLAPMYKNKFLYQKFPNLRIHLPNNVSVSEFHRDYDYHHPSGEQNYIIPLTESKDTATIWVESRAGKKDYAPINMVPGELISFNGNKLAHGNKMNETGKPRLSLDFRILPMLFYKEHEAKQSLTTKNKFAIGEYYKLFEG